MWGAYLIHSCVVTVGQAAQVVIADVRDEAADWVEDQGGVCAAYLVTSVLALLYLLLIPSPSQSTA
jgi:hypothetical protein